MRCHNDEFKNNCLVTFAISTFVFRCRLFTLILLQNTAMVNCLYCYCCHDLFFFQTIENNLMNHISITFLQSGLFVHQSHFDEFYFCHMKMFYLYRTLCYHLFIYRSGQIFFDLYFICMSYYILLNVICVLSERSWRRKKSITNVLISFAPVTKLNCLL